MDSDEGENDAHSVNSPNASDSEQGDNSSDHAGSGDEDGQIEHELQEPDEVHPTGHAHGGPVVSLQQPCSTHDSDVDEECSECQDSINMANEYEQQFPGMQPEIPEDESPDGIPTLLARHARTDERKQTLTLEHEVLMLAQQRLAEGQYESASKFAKLVDKVHLHNSYFSVQVG